MDFIFLLVLTIVASYFGTIAGFGSSAIMTPMVALFLPLPIALLFVAIIHFFNDLWEMILFKHAVRWKVLLIFGIPSVIFSIIGAQITLSFNQVLIMRFFGIFLILYVLVIHFDPKLKLPKNTVSAGVGGGLSGLTSGLFGAGGPIRAIFLAAFKLPKEVYLFTSGAIAMLIDTSRIIAYINGGISLNTELTFYLLFLIPISFVSARFAKKYIKKVTQKKYRQVISLALFLIGLKLLIIP